jgi:hypothetical protein
MNSIDEKHESTISNLPELGYTSSKQASALVVMAPMNRGVAVIKVAEKYKVVSIK